LASLFLVLILFLVLHSRSLANHLSTFYPFFVCLGCSFFIVTIPTVTIVSFFPSVSLFLLGPPVDLLPWLLLASFLSYMLNHLLLSSRPVPRYSSCLSQQ
jgi:hypothetical protein